MASSGEGAGGDLGGLTACATNTFCARRHSQHCLYSRERCACPPGAGSLWERQVTAEVCYCQVETSAVYKDEAKAGVGGPGRGTLGWALRTGLSNCLSPHSKPNWEELLFHDKETGQRYR